VHLGALTFALPYFALMAVSFEIIVIVLQLYVTSRKDYQIGISSDIVCRNTDMVSFLTELRNVSLNLMNLVLSVTKTSPVALQSKCRILES
jgi:hypothetical protein